MNKKEMLLHMLLVAKECEKHPSCDGCPIGDSDVRCTVDTTVIDDIEKELKAFNECEEAPQPVDFKLPFDDPVNHPKHYETGKYECIDVMVETQGIEAVKNFCICNAFKYVYRHKNKNGVEDIRKAIWYLDKYAELDGRQQC